MIKGLQPVEGPDGPQLLDDAVREHAANEHIDEQLIRVSHPDEALPGGRGYPRGSVKGFPDAFRTPLPPSPGFARRHATQRREGDCGAGARN